MRSRFREEVRMDEREEWRKLRSIAGRELLCGQAEWVSGDEGSRLGVASRTAAGMKYLSQYDGEKGLCVSVSAEGYRKGRGWVG